MWNWKMIFCWIQDLLAGGWASISAAFDTVINDGAVGAVFGKDAAEELKKEGKTFLKLHKNAKFDDLEFLY